MAWTGPRGRRVVLGVLVLALAACAGPPTGTAGKAGGPTTRKTRPAASPATQGGLAGQLTRRLAEPLVAAELIGKIRLVSDQGGAILSNNSGSVLSNNGGGIISDNGGGLIGKIRYVLGQAEPPPEALLADAVVEVLDAEGRQLLDAAGTPITATSDQTGAYKLTARLPAGNLVMRVRLFRGREGATGALLAVLPVATGAREQDIDTASTLGCGYVLEQYVNKRQAVFDRLPAAEADALQRDLAAARGLLSGPPTYEPAEVVALAASLRSRAPAVDQTLKRIEAILLAGQSELGEGQPAVTVALSNPFGVVADPRTSPPTLYIGESGRIRRVTAGGLIERFAGGMLSSLASEGNPLDVGLDSPGNLALAADGTLYATDYVGGKVYRMRDGRLEILAGNGARTQGPVGGPARDTAVFGPSTVIAAPDGRVYFGEFPKARAAAARILFVEPDGRLGEVPGPFGGRGGTLVTGMALTPDGTFYVLDTGSSTEGVVWRRDAASAAWEIFAQAVPTTDTSRLGVGPDGTLYMTQGAAHRLVRFNADGTTVVVAGTGRPGSGGDGGPASQASLNEPSAFHFTPDGTLYIADLGNALVRRVQGPMDGTGTIDTVAGTRAATQQGDALTLSLNTPTAITVDGQGRVVVSEGIAGTIKRLENQVLSLIAGTVRGFGGDAGQATAAAFDAPSGLAYDGDTLYVVDTGNKRIRRIAPDGTVETLVGGSGTGPIRVRSLPAAEAMLSAPVGAAVGPDGALYWCDTNRHQVLRLTRDRTVEIVAGGLDGVEGDEGDGAQAAASRLNIPTSVAVDRRGNVYVADTANGRVRRISPQGAIETLAGVPFSTALVGLMGGEPEPGGDLDARAAWLIAPVALTIDGEDRLFVAELGAARLGTLIGALGLPFNADDVPRRGARIRMITGLDSATPRLRTIAGEGSALLAGPTTDNGLLAPLGLTTDGTGRLIIADSGNNQIKLLPAGSY